MNIILDSSLHKDKESCIESLVVSEFVDEKFPVERTCLPFPEMGMDIESVEAYLESDSCEPA